MPAEQEDTNAATAAALATLGVLENPEVTVEKNSNQRRQELFVEAADVRAVREPVSHAVWEGTVLIPLCL